MNDILNQALLKNPTHTRNWQLCFTVFKVGPGETLDLSVEPEVPFTGKKLFAATEGDKALDDLHLDQLFVNDKPQLREPIAFRALTASTKESFGFALDMETFALPGKIVARFSNRGKSAHKGELNIFGTVGV
jgi:hypothetical protein